MSRASDRRRITPMGFAPECVRVLLVQHDPNDAARVREHLRNELGVQLSLTHVDTLREALALLRERDVDAVLVDVALPDAMGLNCLTQLQETGASVPIIVLSEDCDRSVALQAVRLGAQDYLPIGQLYPHVLSRMILHAMERSRFERRLQQIASFDSLTGLANRRSFLERVTQTIARAMEEETKLALLFLDLDRFKSINDGFGHATGDHLLCEVSRRIESVLRQGDTVALLSTGVSTAARLGGDEFAVLLGGVLDRSAATTVAERLTQALARPVRVGGQTFTTSTSVGLALFPDDGGNAECLLRHADSAMYRIKRAQSDSAPAAQATAAVRERVRMESDLHGALSRGEFLLHFQPQMDLRTRRIVGVEALLRWQRSADSLIAPADFIHILNETGLINEVGRWVLSTACTRVRAYQLAHPLEPLLRVAVNVSGLQLERDDFGQVVRDVLARTSLPPASLEIEIVENTLLPAYPFVGAVLDDLSALGVRVALDDFGTGFSSMTHLRDLAVDTLKLDGSFVRHLEHSSRDAELAKAVIQFAHRLDLEVVAEGVEDAGQMRILQEAGCDAAQGYLLGRPGPDLPAGEAAHAA